LSFSTDYSNFDSHGLPQTLINRYYTPGSPPTLVATETVMVSNTYDSDGYQSGDTESASYVPNGGGPTESHSYAYVVTWTQY
ncbi:MAG TPA: hypothetical protein VFL04_08210, partial [Rectinemataceae bacterium]|nr:hypothetical protein [Rectinemataceae bacterium]